MDDNARCILAIAKHGSISKAAEAVHLSQPALSQRLKKVEAQLGIAIFNRRKYPLEPTQAGRTYLDWAKRSARAEDKMIREVSTLADRPGHVLRIGVSAKRYQRLIADATARFYREVPDCTILFFEAGPRNVLNSLLLEGTIDFAILTPQEPEPSLFVSEALCEERFVYVTPAAWNVDSVATGDVLLSVDMDTIAALPFIMPVGGDRLLHIIQAIMETSEAKPKVVMQCAGDNMVFALVRAGLGATITSNAVACNIDEEGISFFGIEGISDNGNLYYSRRLASTPSEYESLFVGFVKEHLKEQKVFLPTV